LNLKPIILPVDDIKTIVEQITCEIVKGNVSLGVFISRAFDIHHDNLLDKLRNYVRCKR